MELSGAENSISEEEWNSVKDFVSNDYRPNLALELLYNSLCLMKSDFKRSALIEAVTALEVAISKFSKTPNFDNILPEKIVTRIDINGLEKQAKHLGLSGTIKVLIPMLFREEDISTELLEKCFEAITVRHNVVHNGQREVKNENILAIHEMCKILIKFTK